MSNTISDVVEKHRPALEPYEDLYKHFHKNPELALVEHETSERIASELKKLGEKHKEDFTIHTKIGKTGIAAVIENGQGPRVLLRADIDGLPVEERTGLPYASKKRAKDQHGEEWPTMHACGHDMHITSLLGAIDLLLAARSEWSGTLILIFQPAEEKGQGAQAMVDDGLYKKIPEPDLVFATHVLFQKSGTILSHPGKFMSAADSMKITLHGQGGHASMPHASVDPITMASYTVTRLQTLVSREIPSVEPAVVTVSSIHAGSAENVISDKAELKLNIRTWTPEIREQVKSGIQRIVKAECDASRAPKPPTFETLSAFPLTTNDVELSHAAAANLDKHFGDAHKVNESLLGGSEDFSILATSVGKPYTMVTYGGTDPDFYDRKEKEGNLRDVPFNHSPYYAPSIHPTLKIAIDIYAIGALTWLVKK